MLQKMGSSTGPSHLVVLFCVSAGKNGEELGSDEEQIVFLVYLLYDVTNNKVRSLAHFIPLLLIVEVLLYVHRSRRLIRDGIPGRPPRLSHSS